MLKKKCRLNRQSNVFELITPFHDLSRLFILFTIGYFLSTSPPPPSFKYIIKLSTSLLLIIVKAKKILYLGRKKKKKKL